MQPTFLTESFNKFLAVHRDASPNSLRLSFYNKTGDFDYSLAIDQIEAIQKFSKKLPNFISSGCRFPDVLVGEQSTNEAVASYHASLLLPGTQCVVDLTAGLGIDLMSIISENSLSKAIAVEMDERRAEVLKWNLEHLLLDNVEVRCCDCRDLITEIPQGAVVFIDPARRGNNNSRIYSIRDSQPDIVELAPQILQRASRLLIKCSPMVDISAALGEIDNIRTVYVVSLKNECKEVLIDVSHIHSDFVEYHAVDIKSDVVSDYVFKLPVAVMPGSATQRECEIILADELVEGMYLYEPNASLMKLACWKLLCEQWNSLKMASISTNLFLSSEDIEEFPGRRFKIRKVLTSKDLKKIKGEHYNIAVRNYPVGAEKLRKQLKTQDGGDRFVYGTRIGYPTPTPILLDCDKL